MKTLSPAASEKSTGPRSAGMLWVAGTLLLCWGVSLVTSQISPQLKRLVLLPAVYGASTGALSGLLWSRLRPPIRRDWGVLCVLLCTGLGAVHTTWISFLEFHRVARLGAQNPQTALALRILETDPDPVAQARLTELRASLSPTLGDYLRHRVRQLGRWSATSAAVFWGLELVIAAGVGGWVWRRFQLSAV